MFDHKVTTLLTLISTGSYTKAAERLNLTQPAVSHQIRLLESEYGIKIFYFDKKELKLTPEGAILAQYARRASAIYTNALQAIDDYHTGLNHLNVGITPTVGENVLPQVFATICNENPTMHINIRMSTIQKLYTRLKAYEMDLAVVEGELSDPELVSTLLDTDYLCLAVAPQHPFATKATVSLQDIQKEKLILRSRSAGTRKLFESSLSARGISLQDLNVIMEVDNVATIKELVSLNLGITVIAHSACRDDVNAGRLCAIPIENSSMVRQITIVRHKDFSHQAFIGQIQAVYHRLRR